MLNARKPFSLIAVALCFLVVNQVSAADLKIPSGNYIKGKDSGHLSSFLFNDFLNNFLALKQHFIISKKGTIIVLNDVKHKIVYRVDLNDPNEQALSSGYLQHARNKLRTQAYANLISKITVTDIKQVSENAVAGTGNFYIDYSSFFGTIRAKIQVGASLATVPCKDVVSDAPAGALNGTCLKTFLGHNPALSDFSLSFDDKAATEKDPSELRMVRWANRIVGLTLDFSLKMLSAMFSDGDELIGLAVK